jgi:hypothetical protein
MSDDEGYNGIEPFCEEEDYEDLETESSPEDESLLPFMSCKECGCLYVATPANRSQCPACALTGPPSSPATFVFTPANAKPKQ